MYTLTKRDAEQVAGFLTANGIAALPYSGEHDTDARVDTEDRLLRNDIKAVVATSALGMGYDKADLSFVVHYQAPGSVVSYYQQVGRAGRGVEHADVVLLRGAEDRRIQDFFIAQAFPARDRVTAALAELELAGDQGLTTRELMATINLGMSRIEAMLKILDVEGAVSRSGSRWYAVPDADWSYDGERYAQVTALRRAEQQAMVDLRHRRPLPDAHAATGARRPQRRGLRPLLDLHRAALRRPARSASLVEQAQRYLRSSPVELEVKKMAPDASGTQRKIPDDVRISPGWSLSRLGDGGWWPVVERGVSDGTFDPLVITGLADLLRSADVRADWITSVPSVRLGDTLARLGERLAGELAIPHLALLARREQRPPQREMANAVQQAANVRGAFKLLETPPAGTGILLDDERMLGLDARDGWRSVTACRRGADRAAGARHPRLRGVSQR